MAVCLDEDFSYEARMRCRTGRLNSAWRWELCFILWCCEV